MATNHHTPRFSHHTPIETRLWSRVRRTKSGCWLWTGAVNHDGYGHIRWGKEQRAHRIAYLLEKGSIPPGMNVCHSCDTPACVNPDHLFLGTQKRNMEDCSRKGRFDDRRGSKNRKAQLVEADIPGIRQRLKTGESLQAIATSLGVSKSAIAHIKQGRTWTHVP